MENPYLSLITAQHRDKPKFMAWVELLTGIFADIKAQADKLSTWWDIDTCLYERLDDVGQWVGATRRVKTPIANVYFAFDTDGLGFDEGAWQGPFDPDSGITLLDDETFRILIKSKISANHWDGTLEHSKDAFDFLFNDDTKVFIQDNQDMTIDICVTGRRPPLLLQALLLGGYIPIKPESVRVAHHIITTEDGPLFGFDIDNQYIAGFDQGSWGAIY